MSLNPYDGPTDGDPDAAANSYAVLVEAAIRGDATPDEVARLRATLRTDPAALDAYLDQIRVHSLLQWRSGTVSAGGQAVVVDTPVKGPGPRRPRDGARPLASWRPRIWAAAAAILLAVAVAFIVARRPGPSGPPSPPAVALAKPVADVAEVHDVVWADGQPPLAVGAELGPGDLSITSGTVRLSARGDAVVTVVGPARVRLVTGSRLQAIAGRITARVGPAGKGFVVDAPGADVVDLGTEFGVQVGPAGETAVVVFEGEVDLTRKPAAGDAPATAPATTRPVPATRLAKGQAVRVSPGGPVDRIVAVARAAGGGDWRVDGPPGPDAVVAAVRDNLRDPAASPMYYQIARRGLAEDVPVYVDRTYQWNGIDAAGLPAELAGADLVMPFNSDKRTPDLELTVVLARPAVLYVFHEPRHGGVPDWLKRGFVETGLKVGLDEAPADQPHKSLGRGPGQSVDRVFSVWRREVREPGPVVLGENSPGSKSMYGIAAAPLK